MATINKRNFPGVITQIIDDSFIPTQTSRFKPGIIGVASKGPFDVPTPVTSLKDFVRIFGKPISGEFYMASAVGIVAQFTDSTTVVRVGNKYTPVSAAAASGTSGVYTVYTPKAALFSPSPDSVYVRVQQEGKKTTVNARVSSINIASTPYSVTFVSAGDEAVALNDNYTDGQLSFSNFSGAANKAESLLYGYTYGSDLSALGTVVGDKNAYTFTVTGVPSTLVAGDIIRITQTGRVTTSEVRVRRVNAKVGSTAVIELYTANDSEVGYQALPLQDSYDAAAVSKVATEVISMYVQAATDGDWANGDGTTGLSVRVSPGSKAGSKKLSIFLDSGTVETIDSLSSDPTSDDYYTTRINGLSANIVVTPAQVNGDTIHPANSSSGWNDSPDLPLPFPSINSGAASGVETGGSFSGGFNGANATTADFVGTVDPIDDTSTGIRSLEDTDSVDVNVIAAPMNNVSVGIMQQLAATAKAIRAIALTDVPRGLNSREAVDWHNGVGVYGSRGRIDNPNIAVYWNWITITDPITRALKVVPPSIGALRCLAFTFEKDKPWYAAAGENRGIIQEASAVEFTRVSADAKEGMYGQGNSVNPILLNRARIMLFGERTLQRAESKLTAVHNVILVNYVVSGLAEIGRRFVFEPNDEELLVHIRLAYSAFLDEVKAERGIESYNLVVDDSNNTADTRNNREAIVDLSVIPVDAMERLYINATVRESGADLNNVVG